MKCFGGNTAAMLLLIKLQHMNNSLTMLSLDKLEFDVTEQPANIG